MRLLPILTVAAALLASVAHPEEVPADLLAIHMAVKDRVLMPHGPTQRKQDFRYIPVGQTTWGNCATFAATVWLDVKAAGHDSEYEFCRTPQGTPHVFVRSGEWALDARYKTPVPLAQVDCRPINPQTGELL